MAELMYFFNTHAETEGIADIQQTVCAGDPYMRLYRIEHIILSRDYPLDKSIDAGLKSAQRLLQRLLEGAADCHHFTDRFHLRSDAVVRLRELLERETRDLRNHIIDRRFKRGRGCSTGDFILQF